MIPEVNCITGCPQDGGAGCSPPTRDIFMSHLLKEPLVILSQLPASLPLAGKPQFWVPSGDSRLSVATSVSSMLSTWWGLPLPKMKMREGDRSWVPPTSSVITSCHHPCTHLEDTGHSMSARYSRVTPYRFEVVFNPLADFSPLFPQHLENFTLASSGRGQLFLDGKGQCPFDPQHTYTALLVGEYGARVGWDGVEGEGGGPHCCSPHILCLGRWRALCWHHEQLPGQ